jgi:hypothetical protein
LASQYQWASVLSVLRLEQMLSGLPTCMGTPFRALIDKPMMVNRQDAKVVNKAKHFDLKLCD